MMIKEAYPPNYKEIIAKIPAVNERKDVVFTYGEVLYNPYKLEIQDHTVIHEQVHSKQQGGNPKEWWYHYLSDMLFRLNQEVEAYGEQYKYAKELLNAKGKKIFLETIAETLASDMYGNMLSQAEAEAKIRLYAK